jgi:PadR family transcriptional regulator PadR
MNSQFKKGIIEMCVLHVVSKRDLYGFAVIDRLSGQIDVNENTIYPILRRLTEQGYFSTYTRPTNVGAPRKYYAITESGKRRLQEFQSEWRRFLEGVFHILEDPDHDKE